MGARGALWRAAVLAARLFVRGRSLRWTRWPRTTLLAALPARPLLAAGGNCLPRAATRRRRRFAGMVRQTEIRIAPEIYRAARLRRGPGRPGGPQGRPAGHARQSRARRIARRGEGGGGQRRPSGTTSMPACVTRRSRSSRRACETAEANLLLAEQQNARAVALAAQGLRQQAEARREQGLAGQGQGRPRPQARPAAAAQRRTDRRGARPRRRQGGARRGDGRRSAGEARQDAGWSRRSTASSASWSPNRARSCRSASRC